MPYYVLPRFFGQSPQQPVFASLWMIITKIKNSVELRVLCGAKTQTKTIQTMSKDTWGKILNILITVLTAIATTFGVTSCMGV